MRIFLLTATLLIVSSTAAFGQAVNSEQTWDIFAGGSVLHTAGTGPCGACAGWDAAVSERPYKGFRWIGGTVEAAGNYHSSSGVQEATYTVMAGPLVKVHRYGVEPFGHFLLGGVVDHASYDSTGSTEANFAYVLGGGVDVPLNHWWAIRGQGDWLRTRSSATIASNAGYANDARISFGAVFNF